MISKHVKEILELFRNNHTSIHCIHDKIYDSEVIEIINTDLYPDDQENNIDVFLLGNNKIVTINDLEFADVKNINGNPVVFLGMYRFYFNKELF